MSTTKEERPTWLVWTDIETTGSDEDNDRILEVGFVITDEALNVKSEFERVVHLYDVNAWRSFADEVVQTMHDENGLWEAVAGPLAQPLMGVEMDATGELQDLGDRHDFVLAGSGVSHFDRRFLAEHMPMFTEWFRYYSIDVGVLRRSLELIGRTDALLPKQDKAHRALDDARYHLEEMRYIKKVLGVGS